MIKERGIVILKDDLCPKWLDIVRECDFNVLGLHTLDKPGAVNEYTDWLKLKETQDVISKLESLGVRVEHELHAVSALLPRSLFETSPSFFREENGMRVKNDNYCPSCAEAAAVVAANAQKLAETLKPSTHRYYLWQDDNAMGRKCNCPDCRGLSVPDQTLMMMRAVLNGLKKADPQAQLAFLAYEKDLSLPSAEIPEDIFLEFAPIKRNHELPLTADSEINSGFKNQLTRLTEMFGADSSHILEYFLDESMYANWKRENVSELKLNVGRVTEDVRFYSSLGIEFITTFAAFMDETYLDKYGYDCVKRYADILHSV